MILNLAQAATLLKDILSLDLKQCDIAVCIASGDPANYSYRRIEQSQRLAQRFREVVDDALKKYREALDNNDIELCDFATDTTKPEQEIEYLNIVPYPSIKQQVEPLAHYLDMPYFQQTERNFINHMRFYAIRVQLPGGLPINFYRHYSHAQVLSQSPFFAMWLQQDLYDDLTQPVFLFDRHIDCFSCDDHMFILQKYNFLQIFEIKELEKAAHDVLAKLEKRDFIHNFSQFKEDCLKDKVKILKLKNISNGKYLDKLTIDDLHKTILRYSLPIQVDQIAGKRKLVYDPKERWAILHLLDDAYADSSMTRASYYLKAKREIHRK